MKEFKITETWKMFVTVEAETKEEAQKIGEELLHNGKMDDVDYEGSDDDGIEDIETGDRWDVNLNEI